MPTETHINIFRLVRAKTSFLITGHMRPDGDLCGTAIALRCALVSLGRKARIVLPEKPPERYLHMDGAEHLEVFDGSKLEADAVFVLDSAGLDRIGPVAAALPANAPIVNIDHHLSNTGFGDVSWVEPEYSSTGEMLYELAKEGGWPLPGVACRGLYAAIVTDTGRFSYSNTGAGTLRTAAELVEFGVSPASMARLLYRSKSERELRLQERALASLKLAAGGRISTMSLYFSDFQELGAQPTDAQDLAALTVSMAGVELGAFLYELEAGKVTKCSLRGTGTVDVSKLASRFGGGGHAAASGCQLEMGLDEARALVIEVGTEALSART
jgi:bifunctional oligoribonuclease and PAP phosphatase NrnA